MVNYYDYYCGQNHLSICLQSYKKINEIAKSFGKYFY